MTNRPFTRGLSMTQADARRTALAKTLWRVQHPRSHPERHAPFNTTGLAAQQAIAENA